jgi:DNA-binding response OmpR family regulator
VTHADTRLLLVEDDSKLVRALTVGLTGEGYAVEAAQTGDRGLALAAEHDYDAVVLDVMLPGIDGFTVCRQLRSEGRRMPVLMLTARTDVSDRIRGLDAGADDYLVKPFDFGELVARLRALLRRGAPARPAVLVAGDLAVDPASRAVTRAGRRVELSAREFGVLELLARRAGQVVSRTELLEHVWDRNYAGSTNIVDVYVGYLRRKLGETIIETVRGAGYRLRTDGWLTTCPALPGRRRSLTLRRAD